MAGEQVRSELKPSFYFPKLDEFSHAALFSGLRCAWEAVADLRGYVMRTLSGEIASSSRAIFELSDARLIPLLERTKEERDGILSSEGYIVIREDIFLEGLSIAIGGGTTIEPGVVIKSPTIIGRDAELRQGAYIRGNVIIGDDAVVGHATEVKNSIFMDHAEAGHFAYVGDSILGMRVNLGAGTKLANLELRTPREKESHTIRPISIAIDGESRQTGLEKLGAILGDDVETGCNSVISPGALIGCGSWVYSNTTVGKGLYGRDVIIRNRNGRTEVLPRRRT
jgi:acetyltransferase-like isoleucine patch superfamily enzyme